MASAVAAKAPIGNSHPVIYMCQKTFLQWRGHIRYRTLPLPEVPAGSLAEFFINKTSYEQERA